MGSRNKHCTHSGLTIATIASTLAAASRWLVESVLAWTGRRRVTGCATSLRTQVQRLHEALLVTAELAGVRRTKR